jgi:hypothetical protein
VWPLDRPRSNECLRIGRHAVERWKGVEGTLSLQSEHALPQVAAPQPQHLTGAIKALYSTVPPAPVTLVLESAWLPVMLVDTGAALLRAAQIDALVRHRFCQHYSDGPHPVAAWELRIEHRAGSRYAFAYGMTPRLKQTLIDAAHAVGLEWAAMTPALAWGMERLRSAKALPRLNGWVAWPEQDRTLLVRVVSNEVGGFNAGAARVSDEPGLLRLIDAESVRLGVESLEPVVAATWVPVPRAPRSGERVTWRDVRGQGGLSIAPALPTAIKKVSA